MGVKVHGTKNMRHRHNCTSHRWVPRHWGMRSFAKLPLGFVPVTIDYLPRASCMYTASCILLLLFWFPTCLFFSLSPSPKPHALSNQRRPRKRPLPTGAGLHTTACLFVPLWSGKTVTYLFFFLSFVCLHLLCSPTFLHFLE
jgi:hypothetical protein